MIYDIERTSVVDGPGIRTTVFFKGCNPYHEMGTQKYAALGKEAAVFSPPSEELMARLRGVFACG